MAIPPFSADFGQTLGPVGSDAPFIAEQERKTAPTPIVLTKRDWTPVDLINELLVNGIAEIAIPHRQTVSLMFADDGQLRRDN